MNISMCVIKDMNKFIVLLKIIETNLILTENLSVWAGQCYVIFCQKGWVSQKGVLYEELIQTSGDCRFGCDNRVFNGCLR
jgi:hypothetical protein